MKKIYDKSGNLFAELNYSKEYFLNYSKHSHDTFCISIIGSGELEIEFHSSKDEYLSPKQLVIFNPNQVHHTKSKSKSTQHYYNLHVNYKYAKKLQESIFKEESSFFSVENIIDDKKLYEDLLKSFENFLLYNENIQEKIENILLHIFSNFCIKEKEEKNEEHLLCEKVKNYIIKNIEEQISLEDIAKEVSYNESYITRVFKNKCGLTPHAYLINKRIQKAKNRLSKDENINLSLLSSEVGFYDQSHFSKVFKRVFAQSPNKYKND